MSRPLFIFGIARSGTNLISGILNSHDKVIIALDPLMPFFKSLRDCHIEESGDKSLINNVKPDMPFQDGYFQSYGYKLIDLILKGTLDYPIKNKTHLLSEIKERAKLEKSGLENRLDNVQGETYEQLLRNILEIIVATKKNNILWHGVKEVWTSDYIPVLANAFPDAKFIINRRDPRAIIASLLEMKRKDSSQAAHTISYLRHWRKEAAILYKLKSNEELSKRIYINYYESLVTNPINSIRELGVFLELDSEDIMDARNDFNFINNNSSFDNAKGISKLSIDKWKTYLNLEMTKTIEYYCAPEMICENYSSVTPMPIKISNDISQQVKYENLNSGSWRSDSDDEENEIRNENLRWEMLGVKDSKSYEDDDIRRHFLFKPYLEILRNNIFQSGPNIRLNEA